MSVFRGKKTGTRGVRKGKTAKPSDPVMPIVGAVSATPTGRKPRSDKGSSRELTLMANMADAFAVKFKHVRPKEVAEAFKEMAKAIRSYDQRDRLEEDNG